LNLAKKAGGIGLSAVMVSSLIGTVFAGGVAAAGLSNIVYQANGAVAGSAVPVSTTAAFVSFNPTAALQVGTSITLTLPSGTTFTGTPGATTFTMVQQPIVTPVAVAVASVAGSGTATPTITLFIPNGSVGTTGAGVTIYYAAAAGLTAITNPTTASSNGTLGIQIQNGDSGSLSGIKFVAGPPTKAVLTANPASVSAGSSSTISAQLEDVNSNLVTTSGLSVTFAVTGSAVLTGSPALTNASGIATVTVTDAVVESVNVTTTAPYPGGPVAVNFTAIGATVACTPSGGTIQSGSTVTCAYSPGTSGLPNPTWTTTNFTPTGPVQAPGATFTAATVTTGTLVGTISVTGSVTATFTYNITSTPTGPAQPGTYATITSVGVVPLGQTSANSTTITLPEQSRAGFPNATAYVTIGLQDSANSNSTITWSGTPVVSAPSSLNASVSTAGNLLTVKITHSDTANYETITITGLKIAVASGAAQGAMKAFIKPGNNGGAPSAADQQFYNALFNTGPAADNASGSVVAFTQSGAASILVSTGSTVLPFETRPDNGVSPVPPNPVGWPGQGGTGLASYCANQPNPDLQAIVIGSGSTVEQILFAIVSTPNANKNQWIWLYNNPGLTSPSTLQFNHNAGEAVTQVNVCGQEAPAIGSMSSPGTVSGGIKLDSSAKPMVRAGYFNQPAGNLTATENVASLFTGGTSVVFTIQTAGVLFSKTPTVAVTQGNVALSVSTPPFLSPDRTTLTVRIAGAGTTPSQITVSNIMYDVASTVAAGTKVQVNMTVDNGAAVYNGPVTNAYVEFAIAPSAAQPTIYIGQNAQATGMITFTEAGAGFFTAADGPNNKFWVCINTGETFTNAPYAIVSGGDLQLLDPNGVATKTAKARPAGSTGCYYWTVFSASTVASTIEIVGQASGTTAAALPAGANNGPQVNVPNSLAPGTTQMSLWVGSISTVNGTPDAPGGTNFGSVANAVRVFQNSLKVAALSQPAILPGATGAAAGNLQLTETQVGQLNGGAVVCVDIVPRTSTTYETARQDVFFTSATTNDLPVITTDGKSGLLASSVATYLTQGQNCLSQNNTNTQATQGAYAFQFSITQGSISAPGQVTISNIKYNVLTDAALGAVQVNVYIVTTGTAIQQSQGVVSNALIGKFSTVNLTAGSAVGVVRVPAPPVGPFGRKTLVVKPNQQTTCRWTMTPLAGQQTIQVWVAVKGSDGTWGPFQLLTTRLTDLTTGNAYFFWKSATPAWVSIQGRFPGSALFGAATANRTCQVHVVQ